MANPLTYIADIVRDGYSGKVGAGDAYQMLGLVAITLVFLFLAVRSYMRSGVSFS
jgi:ABC-type polysaccharide/polyol phosphate export permease